MIHLIRKFISAIDRRFRSASGGDAILLNVWRFFAFLIATTLMALVTMWFGGIVLGILRSITAVLFTPPALIIVVSMMIFAGAVWLIFFPPEFLKESMRKRAEKKAKRQAEEEAKRITEESERAKRKSQSSSVSGQGSSYDDFKWGDPPPTTKQFGYTKSLGIQIHDGMTKWTISDEISDATGENEPAEMDQLEIIKEYHGVLPRKITRKEADDIIEFLEDYYLPCPFCNEEICAVDDECCACSRKLNKLRIPIEVE